MGEKMMEGHWELCENSSFHFKRHCHGNKGLIEAAEASTEKKRQWDRESEA